MFKQRNRFDKKSYDLCGNNLFFLFYVFKTIKPSWILRWIPAGFCSGRAAESFHPSARVLPAEIHVPEKTIIKSMASKISLLKDSVAIVCLCMMPISYKDRFPHGWIFSIGTVKKSFSISPSPSRMSLTKLFLGGNNLYMTSLFPPRESLVSDILAGEGNFEKLFFT